MNSKQFANTVFLMAVEWLQKRVRWTSQLANALVDILFPRFLRLPLPRLWKDAVTFRGIAVGYGFVWLFLFGIQVFLAWHNGALFPDQDKLTKHFFEDATNIVNYLILCEGYCITGFLFLRQSYTVRRRLRHDGVPLASTETTSLLGRGIVAAVAIFLLPLLALSGFAAEIHGYATHYWFMSFGPPNVRLGLAGYYYLFVNLLLLIFVLWVGFAHFGLFRIAREISSYLRGVIQSGPTPEAASWADEETPKKRLASFSWYVLTSKIMVFWIMLNLLSWRLGEPNQGIMYGLSVVITGIFGIWIFSLPRYAVQRHLFMIRQMMGKTAYPDIRGPWVLGISSLIDVTLFSFVVNYMMGDAFGKLLDKMASG